MGSTEQYPGLMLTGEFRGTRVREGKAKPDGSGNYPDKFDVGILVDGETYGVEFRDEAAALDALTHWNGGVPAKGDRVSLLVGARVNKGYLFWFGRRPWLAEDADFGGWD